MPDSGDFQAGDHLCGVYRGEREREEIMLPFLEAGLRAGDKCVCVVDAADASAVIGALPVHLEARARADAKQLDVVRASDMYLRSGSFSASEALGVWKAVISEAMYDHRFNAVRAVEAWSMGEVVPDTAELMKLEWAVSRLLPLYPQVVLCLYDLDRFGGDIVVNLLRTHPKVLMHGMIVENPYFLPPSKVDEAAVTPDITPSPAMMRFAADVAS